MRSERGQSTHGQRKIGRGSDPWKSYFLMRQFSLLLFGSGGHLSSGSVRFVTHRAALMMAIGAAVVFSVIALAMGVAIGMHVSASGSTVEDPRAHHTTRDYVV